MRNNLRFPSLFSDGFGPSALLYPTPTVSNTINRGKGVGLSSSAASDRVGIPRPTIELSLDELPLDERLNADRPGGWSSGGYHRHDTQTADGLDSREGVEMKVTTNDVSYQSHAARPEPANGDEGVLKSNGALRNIPHLSHIEDIVLRTITPSRIGPSSGPGAHSNTTTTTATSKRMSLTLECPYAAKQQQKFRARRRQGRVLKLWRYAHSAVTLRPQRRAELQRLWALLQAPCGTTMGKAALKRRLTRSHKKSSGTACQRRETPSVNASLGASRRASPNTDPTPTLAPDSSTSTQNAYGNDGHHNGRNGSNTEYRPSLQSELMDALGSNDNGMQYNSEMFGSPNVTFYPGPYHTDYLSQMYPIPSDTLPYSPNNSSDDSGSGSESRSLKRRRLSDSSTSEPPSSAVSYGSYSNSFSSTSSASQQSVDFPFTPYASFSKTLRGSGNRPYPPMPPRIRRAPRRAAPGEPGLIVHLCVAHQAENEPRRRAPRVDSGWCWYATAVKNTIKAGFDGVVIDGASGSLVDQFLQDVSNKRTDTYRGPIENQVRFALQVSDAVVAAFAPADDLGSGNTIDHEAEIRLVYSRSEDLRSVLLVFEARLGQGVFGAGLPVINELVDVLQHFLPSMDPNSEDDDNFLNDFDESEDDEEAIAGAVSAPQPSRSMSRPQLPAPSSGSAPPAGSGSPASSASGADHLKALHEAQLALRAAEDKMRKLEMDHAAALQATRSSRSAKGKAPKKGVPADIPNELLPLLALIRTHGRGYAVCVRPWPPPEGAWSCVPRPAVDPMDGPTRYLLGRNADDVARSQALLLAYSVELYDILPPLLHPYMTNTWLIKEFSGVLLDQKCKVLSKGRELRKAIFKDLAQHLDLALFESEDPAALEEDSEFRRWHSTYNDIYPPVIFPPDKPGDRAFVFRSDPIAKFIRMCLYGPGSVAPKQLGKKPYARKNCGARQWGVTEITPGMIAFAAVAVRHLLLPFEDFDPVGKSSHITYEAFFDQYTKLLICKWNSVGLVETRMWLDARVFKGLRPESEALAERTTPGVYTYVDLDDFDQLDQLDVPSAPVTSHAASAPRAASAQATLPVSTEAGPSAPPPAPVSAPSGPSRRPVPAPEPAPSDVEIPPIAPSQQRPLRGARPASSVPETSRQDLAEALALALDNVALAGGSNERQTESTALDPEGTEPDLLTAKANKGGRRGRGGGRGGTRGRHRANAPSEGGDPAPVPSAPVPSAQAEATTARPMRTTRSKTGGA
ncbi:hypothetical protein VTO73DRAFT_11670 [Trametes versicolor]